MTLLTLLTLREGRPRYATPAFRATPPWNLDRPFELTFLLLTLTGALTASERVRRAMLALFVTMVVLTSLRPG